jgi:FlgD Ig-like domain
MRLGLRLIPMAAAFAALVLPSLTAADTDPTVYWLVPYVQYGALEPAPPVPGQYLSLRLVGFFPYDCGAVTDTSVVPGQVRFTLRKASGSCADSARSWAQVFPLGVFGVGSHTITIERTLIREDGSVDVRSAPFVFQVGDPPPPPSGCPLFSYFTTSPSPATAEQPVEVTLHGCFPYPCGDIVQAQVTGLTHVEVTMQERSACGDSASQWARTFDLGRLPAGSYNLRVTVRDVATPLVTQEFGQWLDVLGDPPPPPPPPPPPITGPLFASAVTVPTPATTAAPTVLLANGVFPYECGFVSDPQVLSSSHVALTLRHGFNCQQDTSRVWWQGFSLGILAGGHHEVAISIRDAGSADSLTVQEFSTAFEVVDEGPPPPPPPPPPPVDSLVATRPNPFQEMTQFAVVLDGASSLEVGIYDLQGRAVKSLFAGSLAAGTWNFSWDARRDDGSRAAAGIYFYRMIRPGRVLSRRVVLLPQR